MLIGFSALKLLFSHSLNSLFKGEITWGEFQSVKSLKTKPNKNQTQQPLPRILFRMQKQKGRSGLRMQSALVHEAGQESGRLHLQCLLDSAGLCLTWRSLQELCICHSARVASWVPVVLIATAKLFHSAGLFTFLEKSLTLARSPSLFQPIRFFIPELECPAGTL